MTENYEGYCVKCKAKRAINNPEKVTMKNGRPAVKGACATCGTSLFKILPSKSASITSS